MYRTSKHSGASASTEKPAAKKAGSNRRKKSTSPDADDVTTATHEEPKRRKSSPEFLSGRSFYFVPVDLPRVRRNLLEKRVEENGGIVVRDLNFLKDESPHYIIVDERVGLETLLRALTSSLPLSESDEKVFLDRLEKTEIVRINWLSDCLHQKKLVDPSEGHSKLNIFIKNYVSALHLIQQTPDGSNESETRPIAGFRRGISPARELSYHSDEDHKSSSSEAEASSDSDGESTAVERTPSGKFKSPTKVMDEEGNRAAAMLKRNNIFLSPSGTEEGNEFLIQQLQEIQKTYRNIGDQFRAYAYGRAISSIKRYPHKITCPAQIRELKNVGPRIALHIMEILETGRCEKIDEIVVNDEANKAMNLFVNIHGVGTKTAQKWVQMGYRTLDDVKEKVPDLSPEQRVGLKYYDEFLEKMPRSEVEEIADVVKGATNAIKEGFIFRICGSYIRGREMCGDVDILMTHPDGVSTEWIIRPLVAKLHDSGFLTDDLWLSEGRHKKYFGVCKLAKPDAKHRRLDIIIPPYSDWATCVLGWSGSMYFVRSIRDLAHKKGMSLTDYELRKNVTHIDGKSVGGEHVETPTEESIFAAIGLPYLRPEERDH